MHQPKSQFRDRNRFLERFQGKQQKISRDGLLQMLNNKRQSVEHKQEHKQEEIDLPSTSIFTEMAQFKSKILQPTEEKKHFSKKSQKSYSSQELRQKILIKHEMKPQSIKPYHSKMQESESLQLANKFKLPFIHRSSSQSHIFSKNMLPTIQGDGRTRKHSSSQLERLTRHSDRQTKKMELDEYVLRHLQFLDKFEKQLISSRLSNGLKPNLKK